tara:strand:- start:187 stop:732 length:546 start_codon:yes stop_codon:yes gene_type:complete
MTTKPNDNPQFYISSLKRDNAELTKQNYDLMKKYTVKTSDPVINDVINRIFARHQQGMEKFKRTMADNSKSIPEWIEETIEENIDAISYMSTLKDRIVEREEKLLKENDRLRDELTISELVQGKMTTKIDNLKLEKVKAVEETKKEADRLMINKCTKYEDEIKEVKDDNKKLAKQITDLNK